MNRNRFLFLALSLTSFFVACPGIADAAVAMPSAYSAWQMRLKGDVQSTRTTPQKFLARYQVRWLDTGKTQNYSSYNSALSLVTGKQDVTITDTTSGIVIYSSIKQPFAVRYVTLTGKSIGNGQMTDYTTYELARAAVTSKAFVEIIDRSTGDVIWSNIPNYWLISSKSTVTQQTYQSLTPAISGASSQPNTSVDQAGLTQPVWTPAYDVLVNNQFSGSFLTEASAQAYAQGQTNAQVIDLATGKDVWDNLARYSVEQNGNVIQQFSTQAAAMAFANTLSNVTVIEIANQQVIFTNVPAYLVEVSGKIINSFVTLQAAIIYAQTVANAVVVQISNGQTVWQKGDTPPSNTGGGTSGGTGGGSSSNTNGNQPLIYEVFQYQKLLQSFPTQSAAQAFVQSLSGVQIIDKSTGQILYSNYPSTVKSPIGDYLVVRNGIAVDIWGSSIIPLAPAPSFMQPNYQYVSPDFTHWYVSTPTGDKFVGTWQNPYQTFNLETASTLTASQINQFLATHAVASSVLQGAGKYFIEAQNAYGVNAQYLVAHAIIESAWGTSYFATDRNNLFGYRAYTNNPNMAATFRSVEYDINFEAWFVRNSYLSSTGAFYNGANLNGMNVDYATGIYWSNSIARIMAEIATYSTQIASQPTLPETGNRPFFPYPNGATALATTNLTVYNLPDDAQGALIEPIGTIAKGTVFSVLGDSPGWDKVQLSNGKSGFVDWNPVSLQNMVQVTGIDVGSELDVRSAPATLNATTIDTLKNGQYLVVLKTLSDGWDEVVDSSNKTGYVSSAYVQVIH
nr:hypothetical protein [Bacilli bacterium]